MSFCFPEQYFAAILKTRMGMFSEGSNSEAVKNMGLIIRLSLESEFITEEKYMAPK